MDSAKGMGATPRDALWRRKAWHRRASRTPVRRCAAPVVLRAAREEPEHLQGPVNVLMQQGPTARRPARQHADGMTVQLPFCRSKTALLEKYSRPAVHFLLIGVYPD